MDQGGEREMILILADISVLSPSRALTFEAMALAYEDVGPIQVRVRTPPNAAPSPPLRHAFLHGLWDHLRKFGWRFQFKGISEARLEGWPDGAADSTQP